MESGTNNRYLGRVEIAWPPERSTSQLMLPTTQEGGTMVAGLEGVSSETN